MTSAPSTSASSRPVKASLNHYGVSVQDLADAIGMTGAHPDPSQSPNDPDFPSTGSLIGTLNGQTVVVVAFANADQEGKSALTVQAAAPYLPPGEHWYAGATGWFGYSPDFQKSVAQALASKLGGSIKQIGS